MNTEAQFSPLRHSLPSARSRFPRPHLLSDTACQNERPSFTVRLNMAVCWNVALCSPTGVGRRLEGAYCLHLQDPKTSVVVYQTTRRSIPCCSRFILVAMRTWDVSGLTVVLLITNKGRCHAVQKPCSEHGTSRSFSAVLVTDHENLIMELVKAVRWGFCFGRSELCHFVPVFFCRVPSQGSA
jgi:hypothetical protein